MMPGVVVDSSVWIDHFAASNTPSALRLAHMLRQLGAAESHDDLHPILVGDMILYEVLRGIRHRGELAKVRRVLTSFELVRIGGTEVALRAAEHYRMLRALGITVRKSIDVLIGTFCIIEGHALLHADRDFAPMARHLGLRVL